MVNPHVKLPLLYHFVEGGDHILRDVTMVRCCRPYSTFLHLNFLTCFLRLIYLWPLAWPGFWVSVEFLCAPIPW